MPVKSGTTIDVQRTRSLAGDLDILVDRFDYRKVSVKDLPDDLLTLGGQRTLGGNTQSATQTEGIGVTAPFVKIAVVDEILAGESGRLLAGSELGLDLSKLVKDHLEKLLAIVIMRVGVSDVTSESHLTDLAVRDVVVLADEVDHHTVKMGLGGEKIGLVGGLLRIGKLVVELLHLP